MSTSLRQGLELIVQYPEATGGYRCRGFRNLHLPGPVFIAFDGGQATDQWAAHDLGASFCQEILRHAGVTEEVHQMPCGGANGSGRLQCHAMETGSCRKILVRPSSSAGVAGSFPAPSSDQLWLGNAADPTWDVLPMMPQGAAVAANLPAQWQGINVCFWKTSPLEQLWAVLQWAGLAPEESRLFISYVRRDTTVIADQLFEALTDIGYDVFLDRCSVPVAVQFQERLMQDLCDKAMVVLLNSPNVVNSHWVGEEIAIIKTYRLGLLELRLPKVAARQDIDPDFVRELKSSDLVSAGVNYPKGAKKLKKAALQEVVQTIKDTHGRALHRRRYELIDNFAAALAAAGKSALAGIDGSFLFNSAGGNETMVGLAARPPELADFCSLHQRGAISSRRSGWLVSPAPFFQARRQNQVAWLGGLSNIQHADEAQMLKLVTTL